MSLEANVKRSKSETEVNSDVKAALEIQRLKDREIVKGIFRFHEVPNGRMEFVFKKYKKDPVEKFILNDGQVYSVPLGVAKHLNTNVSYPIYSHTIVNEQGVSELVVKERIRRCSFQGLEFIDMGETPKAVHSNTILG